MFLFQGLKVPESKRGVNCENPGSTCTAPPTAIMGTRSFLVGEEV